MLCLLVDGIRGMHIRVSRQLPVSRALAVFHARLSTLPAGSSTAAIHADSVVKEGCRWPFSTANDVSPPLSLSTTFECPGDHEQGHIYSRISNPTRDRCEALLGAVESAPGAEAHAVLYSSGLAATFAVLSRLLPGRVAITGGYHGTYLAIEQIRRISRSVACEVVPLPAPEAGAVASSLQAGDVIWLETPRNPDCHVADIGAYVAAAARTPGVRVVVDGTFAPPPLQRPLLLGVCHHPCSLYPCCRPLCRQCSHPFHPCRPRLCCRCLHQTRARPSPCPVRASIRRTL